VNQKMNKKLIEMIINLLNNAKCPNCDGSGAILVQVREREYITREMAMDAGCPEMEGSLYSDDEWDYEQCPWCFEKDAVIKELQGLCE